MNPDAITVTLTAVYTEDKDGMVRATLREIPEVITCARTRLAAEALLKDALREWQKALTA
jgi:predicted RNase H-like HicB family nuclease